METIIRITLFASICILILLQIVIVLPFFLLFVIHSLLEPVPGLILKMTGISKLSTALIAKYLGKKK